MKSERVVLLQLPLIFNKKMNEIRGSEDTPHYITSIVPLGIMPHSVSLGIFGFLQVIHRYCTVQNVSVNFLVYDKVN